MQPPKRELTLRVVEDVVRFFRAMGQGHLMQMNDVLRAFMLARLAEVVKGEIAYKPPPAAEEEYRAKMAMFSRMLLARMREGQGGLPKIRLKLYAMQP